MSSPLDDRLLKDLESALARLQPCTAQFNRDRLMFEAGRRSARHGWFWPATTIVSTLTAAVLGFWGYWQAATPAEQLAMPAAGPGRPVSSAPPEKFVQQQPLPAPAPGAPSPVLALPVPTMPVWWVPFSDGPTQRERELEQPLATRLPPPITRFTSSEAFGHWLGFSWQDWQQTPLLGKATFSPHPGGW